MSGQAWASSLVAGSLFWVSFFLLHYAAGNSWPVALLLALSALVAGMLLAAGFSEAIARKARK